MLFWINELYLIKETGKCPIDNCQQRNRSWEMHNHKKRHWKKTKRIIFDQITILTVENYNNRFGQHTMVNGKEIVEGETTTRDEKNILRNIKDRWPPPSNFTIVRINHHKFFSQFFFIDSTIWSHNDNHE